MSEIIYVDFEKKEVIARVDRFNSWNIILQDLIKEWAKERAIEILAWTSFSITDESWKHLKDIVI